MRRRHGLPWVFFIFVVLLFSFQNFAPSSMKKTEIKGEVTVLTEDYGSRGHKTRYFLKDIAGRKFELKFKGQGPQISSGSVLKVSGDLVGNTLELDSNGSTSSVQVLASATASVFGEQKTAVILVNFQAYPIQPFSLSSVQDVVFNKVSNFFLENSSQQTWLNGQVFGWYTMPIAFTCDTTLIASTAKQQALNAGVDLSPYARFIYIFPTNGACSWSGVGSVGGSPSETWINGELTVKTIGHELGHNLGLYHAHSLECGSEAISSGSTCSSNEYGDSSSIMGNISSTHFSGFQKEQLGWIASGRIVTVSAGGSFNLASYESSGASPIVLKIPKGIDSSSGKQVWYYLEYRQPIGFDAELSSLYSSNLVNGVQIRIGTDGTPNSNFLLDTTPNSIVADDINDGALGLGKTFLDSASGVSISVSALSASSATVSVAMSQPCVAAKPTVTINPSIGPAVLAGTSVSYAVNIKNNNASVCGSSMFTLSTVMPSGLSGSFNPVSVSLASGASANLNLSVQSVASLAAGNYNFTVNVQNGANPSYSGSASASYTVAAPVNLSVVTDKSSYAKGATVSISASLTQSGVAVSGVSVQYTITKPGGAIVTGTATTSSAGVAVYKLRLGRKDPAGSYLVKVQATSGGQTVTAQTSFAVN